MSENAALDVAIAGGHGKIALRLAGLLAARGDRARGIIRNPDHRADLEAAGAEAVIVDLEAEPADVLAAAIAGAGAAVFAAGAGPGSGPERKRTVDLGAAVKLIEACRIAGISRYVMVSAIGVDGDDAPAQMRPYYEAKREADAAVRDSGLDYTIVRPGRLTDEPGRGRVAAGMPIDAASSPRPEISRDDVAATLLEVLDRPRTAGLEFDLLAGEVPIDDAVGALIP